MRNVISAEWVADRNENLQLIRINRYWNAKIQTVQKCGRNGDSGEIERGGGL